MIGDSHNRLLGYLKNQGPTNTFRLSRELDIERHKIVDIVKELKGKQAIEFEHGIVRFLKFPEEKKLVKKPVEIKKVPSRPKKRIKRKVKAKKTVQSGIKPPEELEILENLQEENKRLKEKLSKLKFSIKKQSDIENKFKAQVEYIEKLEKTIKELKQKANVPHKIIRKTIIKKVSVKVKKKPIKRKKSKQKKIKPKKFNLSKINFTKLKKNIRQLHIPKILKNLKR